MPLKNYGVWVGYPKRFKAETDDDKPHIQLYFDEEQASNQGKFRAAINIKSSTADESRLVYWFVRNFNNNNDITDRLANLDPGFHPLSSQKKAPALDYIRGNLFRTRDGSILAHNEPGEKNDIIDYVSPVLTQAINRKAQIYLFGEQFPDHGQPKGIHDVHMNQGSDGTFASSNGTWQDGGILLHFPDDGHWEGIFLAFGVQSTHTDDRTGHSIGDENFVQLLDIRPPPIPVPKPTPGRGEGGEAEEGEGTDPGSEVTPDPRLNGSVFIRAALLNPIGPDQAPTGDPETVYLINKSTATLDLTRSAILNRNGDTQYLSAVLAGQSSKGFAVPNAPLSNKGGTITLLDSRGLKVDGVSYSKAQAQREGDLVYFG